jgi:N-acetylmuramoyl-L-alanine amidase
MKNHRIIICLRTISIIMAMMLSGCKTQQKIPGEQVVPEAEQSTVFFFTDGGLSSLKDAVETAHTNRQQIFAVLNFPGHTDPGRTIPFHLMIADLKREVRNLVTNYDIDGLGIRISDHSHQLVENMTVEAMLLKPYLVNFVVWSGDDEYKNASVCLNEGIIDLIIPDSKIERNPAKLHQGLANLHHELKKINPDQVIRLDLSPLFPVDPGGRKLKLGQSNKSLITDSDGCISFISTKKETFDLVMDTGSVSISTSDWIVPYNYSVGTNGRTIRKSPWVEFRRMPRETTDLAEFDLLCKTDYPSKVWINGEQVKQYKTGIFFKKITLNEGTNRVRATVMTQDSLSVFYEREFSYVKSEKTRAVFPLWIDQKSVEPATDSELTPDDIVRVTFRGSLGQEGFVKVVPGKIRLKCSREDFGDYSVYRADLYLKKLAAGKSYSIVPGISSSQGPEKIQLDSKGTLKIKNTEEFPLVKVKNENSRLTYNLGAPRLGGPIRSEFGPGVILKTSGRSGDYFRISLSSIESGYIHKDDVEILPEGTVVPSYIISSMSCGPSSNADILTIPYPEPVPYEVFPEPDQKRIVITLYGVQTASTWITHLNNRKIIDKVTWQQTTPETYRVIVSLNTSDIWGYDFRPDGKRLIFSVKYPPVYDVKNEKPLSGLKIAIEAGHGGSGVGAVGLSGLPEKEINLDLSLRLGDLCKSMGAEIIQVRDSDIDMTLTDKRNIAVKSDADMLISIHANAGGRGYLSVAGTSTYWHNPFWAPLAENIYDRLLELDLKEFGVIGSFNYTVTRVSQMPSVLVEQAFMSHAEDEEKLADPQFRQQMALKIFDGLIDYLKMAK